MLKKNTVLIIFLITALFSIGLYGNPSCAHAEDAVDFSLKRVADGSDFSFAQQKGKCSLIVFGSMYCKPCIELIPVVARLYEAYKPSGFLAVGVDIDMTSDDDKLKNFALEKKISFPFLRDNGSVAKKNKVFMLPTTLIVDGSGLVVKRYTGYQSYDTLEKMIKKYFQ
ncbi:MAG: TlpA disulfide reductase family protein [Pseudomonadota bacterium]